MKQVRAVFGKQSRDTRKNMTVLIQFVLLPLMSLVMTRAVTIDGMPPNFFVELFAPMYMGMAPLVAVSAVVAEEKETGTLRALLMAGVTPPQYLLGTGGYIWLACMAGSLLMVLSGHYSPGEGAVFLGIMAAGIAFSLLAGAAIGVSSRSQMGATSIAVPVMMVLSFLPMLSLFNPTVASVAKFIYTRQFQGLLSRGNGGIISGESLLILGGNGAVLLLLFALAYRKNGLE